MWWSHPKISRLHPYALVCISSLSPMVKLKDASGIFSTQAGVFSQYIPEIFHISQVF